MKARFSYLALYLTGRALWLVSDALVFVRVLSRLQQRAENRGCDFVQAAFDLRDKATRP